MTDNERDIIQILEFLLASKAPTDRTAAALQRLLAQLPRAAAIDTKADSERAALIEKNKGPPNPINHGLVLGLPPSPAPDGELRKDFIEAQKRPHYRPSPPTGV